MGGATSAAVFGGCAPQPAPTATPEPTLEIEPIVPEMILVEAGSYEMGSTDGAADEQPVHTVHITRPFYFGTYEVTFEEYDRFCEDVVGRNKPDDAGRGRGRRPVVGVDWDDAVAYCNWLSEKERLTPCYSGKGRVTRCDFAASGYRLPTEAEWEYAARGGPVSQGHKYAGSDDADDVAWYDSNSDGYAHPVGEKQPNELGLYDMSGNRWEWCWDWYAEDYYASSPSSDPTGPPPPSGAKSWELSRVRRGSAFGEGADHVRVAFRSYDDPSYPGGNGFRVARTK